MLKNLNKLRFAEIGNYSPGLNTIKGLLVLTVIFGHAINITSNLQTIYFFHMPLFLAISGFLIKKSAFENGIVPYLKKLLNRAIIPWAIAFLIFIPISFYHQSISTFSIKNIIYPYYHLWYIPAYLLAAYICFLVVKFNVPIWLSAVITVAFTATWFIVYRDTSQDGLPLFYLGDKRIYGYLTFFFVGFAIRNKLLKWRPSIYLLLLIISITMFFVLLFIAKQMQSNGLLLIVPYLICNIGMVFFIVIYTSSQSWSNNKFILFINNQSLGIYLYHPLFIFIAYEYLDNPEMNKSSTLQGFIIFIVATLLSSLLVWVLTKFNITNKYLLGNIK
jgi:peptidoglycan/LPS O-acetylase OafA/YrhL